MFHHPIRIVRWTLLVIGIAWVPLPVYAQAAPARPRSRAEIEERYTWNLADMYPDIAAWEADYAACERGLQAVAAFRGKVGESADRLLEFLTLRDEFGVRLEKLSAYAAMLRDQDTREPGPQALAERARNLGVRWGEALAWFEPEVLALPEGQLREWCRSHAKLGVYTHYFEDLLRQRKHVLSAREEELLAMSAKLAGTPRLAFGMLANADMKFPTIQDSAGQEVQVSEGRYVLLLESPDRAFRERAFRALVGTYLNYKNTFAALLGGSVQGDIFRARARHYDSALHAAVDPDNVPVAVYENLIATVREHLPKFHRYLELRRRKLGVDRVHAYDLFVPLIEGEAPRIEYDEAVATILRGLAVLGPEYREPMQKAFRSRWIDVYETPGKRTGAYSMGTYASHPYILLNYSGSYEDLFTVAHELGHALHSWFTQHAQPPIYGDYPIFLAEVASTCNEVILGEYLRQEAKDDAERLFLLNKALEGIRGTVINQTMWAEFEKVLHEEAEKGTPLTYETIARMYRQVTQDYYGPDFAWDEELDGYWMRVPHFYRAFYVYKYATSYCASVALARRVLTEEPGALEAYLGFLKAGSSDYPIEILRKAGVDMSTPAPIHATLNFFGELLDELEKLLKLP